MGRSIGFYCGSSDLEFLQRFSTSIGLHILAPLIDRELSADPVDGPFCYLSVVSGSELHPFGHPPVRLTDARDPLLAYMRAYFKNPYLVAGHIGWSDDVATLAVQTRPYFEKISRWMKKEWGRLPGGDYYVGPEARSLIDKGAQMINALPGQGTFQLIKV
ncbi:hypothetical protein [Dyella choica]|uniref:Uncharacterized protein n=1 Tax=Dyella choica TaxID=1927959 RepID=A0A432M8L9_9GAMM|nr:hypothetical protein [Dyella choica]RUL78248.1 hypothetical protein EKH80_05285 [Dyella choica]